METGTRIGDYEVMDELGRGGMGRVYRVRNVIADRLEAMKVLLPGVLGNEELSARFLREIKVLAALNHPNIAALRTALTADGQVAMIMELVDGESLARRLTRGPLGVDDALAYTGQVLAALAYAHARGVIHRDIKPANMMVTADGTVKLTDFGIARSTNDPALTATGTTAGSLSYMSPEQVNGAAVDARSDLYSVGISLYEMVAGRPPFKASSEYGVMAAHLTEPPRAPLELRPDLPVALNSVILRAIEKDPAARYQSADEFRAALVDVRQSIADAALAAASAAAITSAPATPASAERTVLRAAPAAAGPPMPDRAGPPASNPGVPTPRVREGSVRPLVYIGVGAALVVVVAAGAGSYLRQSPVAPASPPAGESSKQTSPAAGIDTREAALPAPEASQPAADAARPDPFAAATSPAAPQPTEPSAPEPAGRRQGAAPAPASPARPEGTRSGDTRGTTAGPATPNAAPPGPQAAAPPAASGRGETAASTAETSRPAAAPQPAQASASPPPASIPQLQDQFAATAVRAAAVNDSLDALQQQQARQGLGLRGDIAARQRSLNLNLSRAEGALGRGDAAAAARALALADSDLELVERFLGR